VCFLSIRLSFDALACEPIDAHPLAGMQNLSVTQHQAYMGDAVLVIGKKGQIAGCGFLGICKGLSCLCLLPRIARQVQTVYDKHLLYESGTIYPPNGGAAPEVGGAEVQTCGIADALRACGKGWAYFAFVYDGVWGGCAAMTHPGAFGACLYVRPSRSNE